MFRLTNQTNSSLSSKSKVKFYIRNPALVSRKLDLVMEMMDNLDPRLTAWRGKLVYDVTRFGLVKTLQDLQARRLGPDKVERALSKLVRFNTFPQSRSTTQP